METLSNGYKKPEDNDLSEDWFDALEDNIVRVNSHNHDGENSEILSAGSVSVSTATISSDDWVEVLEDENPTGIFSQTVQMPGLFNFDTRLISFRLTSTGEPIFPKIVKKTVNTYDIFVNDDSISIIAIYT